MRNALKVIMITALIAGTLDIATAFIDYYIQTGKGPENVLRFIASGCFGNDAFTGSSIMIWIGLLFHYLIALIFTVFFFILYPKVKLLHINIILTTVIIGIVIWVIMNRVVVPLSNTPKFPFKLINAIKATLILICMLGLPMAISFRKYYSNKVVN